MNSTDRSPVRLIACLTLSVACLAHSGCLSTSPTPSVDVARAALETDRLLIENVSIFSPETLSSTPGMDVLIVGETIAEIAPTGTLMGASHARVFSGAGGTLVPGLIDMHGHISTTTGPTWEFSSPDPEAILRAYVYSGVTTVFDPADSSADAFDRRDRVARGELIGPHIFTTGKILTNPGGHPRSLVRALAPGWIAWYVEDQVATAIATEAEAFREVDRLAKAGADGVKIVIDSIPLDAPRMSQAIATAIVSRAREHGLRTVAHIGTTEDAIIAAEAGVALWVHGVYKEPIADDAVTQLAAYGIPVVTTSEVFDRYGRGAAGPIEPTRLERETVPQSVLDSFYPIPDDFDLGALAGWVELARETTLVRRDNVRRMHAAGVTILAGSDVQSGVFPGASLHRELHNLVDAGMSPAQAMRAATLDSARFLADGAEPDFGLIAIGKRADLLLVDGDPTVDIGALASIREVILSGHPIVRTPVSNAP